MPYTPEHRARTRARIVRSAQRLFSRYGFQGVSIDQIMAEAKLTRGGFYRHFRNKAALYAEALDSLFADPEHAGRGNGAQGDGSLGAIGPQIVRAYLSPRRLRGSQACLPVLAQFSDGAPSDSSVRGAYETALAAMVEHLQANSAIAGRPTRAEAMAIVALCIGGMVVARAGEGLAIANEVREGARTAAMAMGGWASLDAS